MFKFVVWTNGLMYGIMKHCLLPCEIRAIRANPSSNYEAWSGLGHCQTQFGLGLSKPPTRPNPPELHHMFGIKVFPKGSPFVADISRAVINTTESRKILDTEQQWFGNTTCPERNSFTSNSLTLQSFIGLFFITGCVTVLFLIVYIVKYIYGNIDFHKRIWDSSTTTWSRFCALSRHFDQRDLSSYPFKKKRDRVDQELELNDISGSFHFSDAPSLSRNSNSNEMVSPVEEVYDAIEGVYPNSDDMVVVHIRHQMASFNAWI